MSKKFINNIIIEGGRIIFRNFAGEESKFNRAGNRNFCAIISNDMVDQLKEDGWNIKELPPREEEDEPTYYLQVTVSYKVAPPKIMLITNKYKTKLSEDTVASIDYADIENVDMVIHPYLWEVNGKSGVKAYFESMYVKIREDYFASKYSDLNTNEDVPTFPSDPF